MKTLLLDQSAWDLVLDAAGSIAVATDPYQIAQDVASAVQTFRGECWYDTKLGMPYWQDILGKLPPPSLVKAEVVKNSLTVPNVVAATVTNLTLKDRKLGGSIQTTDTQGKTLPVSF